MRGRPARQVRPVDRAAAGPAGVRRPLGVPMGRLAAGRIAALAASKERRRSTAGCGSSCRRIRHWTAWRANCCWRPAMPTRSARRTSAASPAMRAARPSMSARCSSASGLQCANCHNHPLDRWTQDDYHGLAAVFARLNRGVQVSLRRRGEVIHPRTGEPARPRIPGDPLPGSRRRAPGLRRLADRRDLTSPGRWSTGSGAS